MIENLRFLHWMFMDLRRGLNLIAVGKAYDDDLYAFIAGGDEKCLEYEGFRVAVLKVGSLSDFLRYECHLQRVDDEIVAEALSPQPRTPIGQNMVNSGGSEYGRGGRVRLLEEGHYRVPEKGGRSSDSR